MSRVTRSAKKMGNVVCSRLFGLHGEGKRTVDGQQYDCLQPKEEVSDTTNEGNEERDGDTESCEKSDTVCCDPKDQATNAGPISLSTGKYGSDTIPSVDKCKPNGVPPLTTEPGADEDDAHQKRQDESTVVKPNDQHKNNKESKNEKRVEDETTPLIAMREEGKSSKTTINESDRRDVEQLENCENSNTVHGNSEDGTIDAPSTTGPMEDEIETCQERKESPESESYNVVESVVEPNDQAETNKMSNNKIQETQQKIEVEITQPTTEGEEDKSKTETSQVKTECSELELEKIVQSEMEECVPSLESTVEFDDKSDETDNLEDSQDDQLTDDTLSNEQIESSPPSTDPQSQEYNTDGTSESSMTEYCSQSLEHEDSDSEPEKVASTRPRTRGQGASPKARKRPKLTTEWSSKDTRDYRDGYPGKRDNPRLKDNLLFYTNKKQSQPRGDYIDNIHKYWWGKYDKLESHHGFIQWIFPIRESGMNSQAQELQLHEAKAICEDKKAHERVLKSYEMMLDFYGMKLVNKDTGEIERAKHWEKRYQNLNWSMHNYLRITRILKSLGEFRYEHLQAPFVQFVLKEVYKNDRLTNCLNSCVQYWIHTIKDDGKRTELLEYVHKQEELLYEEY
ncbi:uncharacterized protein LOC102805320 [Saccoglossus kowalevskii]|uniref:Myb-like protein X-like n=1 Tax=Saccoglossus kowalevskii TaxID=10224 RepID=A0ABM0MM21_SACKO|nr:PREDICTED: myb-like protein X-like [Saccoglossus kowalevskii]